MKKGKEKIENEDKQVGFDFNVDFDMSDIDFDATFDIAGEGQFEETRYIKPKIVPLHESQVHYEYAEDLARDIDLRENSRYDVIVSGNFVFGDFIEAFVERWNCRAEDLTISTLSLNQNNIDSLHTLQMFGYIGELNLIVSSYFYAMNRNTLIPYIYENLDNGHFQLAVAGVHTKTMTMRTAGGKHIVMHGSANLRSSGSIEQFCIEENREVYDFYKAYCDKILDKYKTINREIRNSVLWSEIARKKFE